MRTLKLIACAFALIAMSHTADAHGFQGRHHHFARHAHYHQHRSRVTAYAGRHHGGDAVAIAMRYVGRSNPTGSGRAWCGDFANMTERAAGRPGVASGLASAWLHYGRPSAPVRGALAIFRGASHVARVIQRLGSNQVELISGNWSHRVMIHKVFISQIAAFRM